MSCLTLRPRASCARVAICWHPTSLLSSSTPEIHFWSSSRCISPTMVYRRVHDGVGDMCVNDRIGDMVNYGTGDVGNCGTGDVWNCGVGDMGNCRVRDAGNYGVGDMAGKLWGRRYGKGGVRDMGNAGLTCGSIASATDAIATSTARRTTASGWWRNDHERSKSARLWKGGGGVDRGRGGRGL